MPFNAPSNSEFTDFFKPQSPGLFLGTLTRFEDTTRTNTFKGGVVEPAIRWHWDFANLDGTPIIDPATGKQADITAMTSASLHIKATGYKYMCAHIGRTVATTDDPAKLAAEAMSKKVMLQIGPNTKNNLSVQGVIAYTALPTTSN